MLDKNVVALAVKRELVALFGARLVKLILYGSYARGDYREDSDIDFLVVLRDREIQVGTEIHAMSKHLSKLGSEFNTYISAHPTTLTKLAESNLQPKTHQGVYVKFNELFVKNGAFSKEHRDNFREVFELRQSGDYDLDFEPTEENAKFAIDSASKFLSSTKAYLDF